MRKGKGGRLSSNKLPKPPGNDLLHGLVSVMQNPGKNPTPKKTAEDHITGSKRAKDLMPQKLEAALRLLKCRGSHAFLFANLTNN